MNALKRQVVTLATGLAAGSLGGVLGHTFGKTDAQYEVAAINRIEHCAAQIGDTATKGMRPAACEGVPGYQDHPIKQRHPRVHPTAERLLPAARTVLTSTAYREDKSFVRYQIGHEEQYGIGILVGVWALFVLTEAGDRRSRS
jgi:hypothetical protein